LKFKNWLIALTPSGLAALFEPLNDDEAVGPDAAVAGLPLAEVLSPSTFLNQVSNFLTNFQFFFFNSTAARYCWYVPC